MKKFILPLICSMMSIGGISAQKVITLEGYPEDNGVYRPSVGNVPTVEYEEATIIIKNNEPMPNVHVNIKDAHGTIIYSREIFISPTPSRLELTSEIDSRKHSIELKYDDKLLSGIF